jgi:hypothetical protein
MRAHAYSIVFLLGCQARSAVTDAGMAAPLASESVAAPSATMVATVIASATALQSETTQWLAAIRGYDAGTAPLSADKAAPAFRRQNIDDTELTRIVGTVPELARFSGELRLFTQGDALQVSKKGRDDPNGVIFSEKPLLWAPEPGAEVLVLTGHSKNTGFIIALYSNPGGATYRLASFMMMPGDPSPVVLAYRSERRRELFWTSCWGCSAEQGGVSYRDDKRVVIVQH